MKFLADVNIDRRLIDHLRTDGHDVLWITDINRELDDISLLPSSSSTIVKDTCLIHVLTCSNCG